MPTREQRNAHDVIEAQMQAMLTIDHFLAHKTVQGNSKLGDAGRAIRGAMHRANRIACYVWFRDELDEPVIAGTPTQVIQAQTNAIRTVMRLRQHSTVDSNAFLLEAVDRTWQAIVTANALACVLMYEPDLEPGAAVLVRAA